MSVLARDIDAYQRAVDQYKRQRGAHNAQVTDYNNTLVSQDGKPVVVFGGLLYVIDDNGVLQPLPGDPAFGDAQYPTTQYQTTPVDGSNDITLLRQNPSGSNTTTVTGAYTPGSIGEGGGSEPDTYYQQNPDGSYSIFYPPPGMQVSVDPATGQFTATQTDYSYPDRPPDFTAELKAKRPDPTQAQMRKLGQPGLAAQERGGLIGDVIRSNGLKSGGTGRVQGGKTVGIPDDPPPTDTPIDQPVYDDFLMYNGPG